MVVLVNPPPSQPFSEEQKDGDEIISLSSDFVFSNQQEEKAPFQL